MENILHEYIGLLIAVAVVLIVIVLQIISFVKTKKKNRRTSRFIWRS